MQRWDSFIESHPHGTPYHLSSWIRTIHETYSFKPILYVLENGPGNINGIFPFFQADNLISGCRIISLPFSDHCGPLFQDKGQEKEALLDIIKKIGHQCKYIEIRGGKKLLDDLISYNHYLQHVLKLDSAFLNREKLLDKRTIQCSIRKAVKKGVVIKEENSSYGMEEFYKLNILTRKKHGVPSQPKKFFKNMFKYMISKGYANIFLSFYQSEVVAATMFFKLRDTLYYKYNASNPYYLSKVTPNHLLTLHAIESAQQAGYRFLDFGRTSSHNIGLIRFKELWGAKPLNLPYYYYPKIKGLNAKEQNGFAHRLFSNIWRSLPDAISAHIGPVIYKHMA